MWRESDDEAAEAWTQPDKKHIKADALVSTDGERLDTTDGSMPDQHRRWQVSNVCTKQHPANVTQMCVCTYGTHAQSGALWSSNLIPTPSSAGTASPQACGHSLLASVVSTDRTP